jgi:predicted DNA repair protein MutK
MAFGLLATLDEVAALVRLTAASLDDVIAQSSKAGIKAAGVVVDDAAVTPRYVVGLNPERELPMIGKIAAGSLLNKLILLPLYLLLNWLAPDAIIYLLGFGGAYLAYEGAEKVYESICQTALIIMKTLSSV